MVRARAENLKPKWKKMNRVEMAIVSSQSYACMTILRRFTLALFVFLMLVACNAARTTPIEALRRSSPRDYRRCHHPVCLSDFRLECRSLSDQARRVRPIPAHDLASRSHVGIHRWRRKRRARGGSLCPRSMLCGACRFTSRLWRDRSATGGQIQRIS
jgi:hypothetical protein